jgi:hypothetical protein
MGLWKNNAGQVPGFRLTALMRIRDSAIVQDCICYSSGKGALQNMARVQVINETTDKPDALPIDWTLWFQWCRYLYDNPPETPVGTPNMQYGYRFIWKRPQAEGGSLQAARGQARIPSVAVLQQLVAQAKAAGWGDYNADDIEDSFPVSSTRARAS